MDAVTELRGYCFGCYRDDMPIGPDGYGHGCDACRRARDEHPTWAAIQRVERGEATVRRRADIECHWFGHDTYETSDGWSFVVFSDGECFADWDYIDRIVAPDGTVYHFPDDRKPNPIPALVWGWSPDSDAECRRWAVLPSGWSRKPGNVERVERGQDPL